MTYKMELRMYRERPSNGLKARGYNTVTQGDVRNPPSRTHGGGMTGYDPGTWGPSNQPTFPTPRPVVKPVYQVKPMNPMPIPRPMPPGPGGMPSEGFGGVTQLKNCVNIPSTTNKDPSSGLIVDCTFFTATGEPVECYASPSKTKLGRFDVFEIFQTEDHLGGYRHHPIALGVPRCGAENKSGLLPGFKPTVVPMQRIPSQGSSMTPASKNRGGTRTVPKRPVSTLPGVVSKTQLYMMIKNCARMVNNRSKTLNQCTDMAYKFCFPHGPAPLSLNNPSHTPYVKSYMSLRTMIASAIKDA
jgi:hypothetical protein